MCWQIESYNTATTTSQDYFNDTDAEQNEQQKHKTTLAPFWFKLIIEEWFTLRFTNKR